MADVDPGVLPTLLRGSRATYSWAIRAALIETSFDDVPRHGAFVLGAVSATGSQMSQIIGWLGISKQAAGQVVDTLVTRGYLERSPDPEDRRRMSLNLTERGELAAAVSRAASAHVQEALVKLVGQDDLQTTRATLFALASLGRGGNVPGIPVSR